jgi:1,4-dihydroxy-2-naphthoate octaprenyltransferase
MKTFLSVAFWLWGLGSFVMGAYAQDLQIAIYLALFGIFCAITSGLVLKD